MKKICFYNHWHNGDVFSGKGYMLDIMQQLGPRYEFSHAQLNSTKSMCDLPCEHIHTDQLPPQVTAHMRYIDVNGTFYINTWVGAYGNAVIPQGEHHANWPSLLTMWTHIMEVIQLNLAPELSGPDDQGQVDISRYIPSTDWTPYDTGPAVEFLSGKNRVALFCNGLVRSTQSHIGLMEDVLEQLCADYKDIAFVCTSKFDNTFNAPNLYFTDDIFANVQEGDINEIAFLSTKCELIVGKNSGPFMFAHLKENVFDPNKTFFSLSHRPSDSYAHNVSGLPCRYYHYSEEAGASIVGHLRRAIDEKGLPSPRQMIVLD